MARQAIRAVLLDLDDTLWPVWPVIKRAEREVRQWLQEVYPLVHERFDAQAMTVLRQELMRVHADKLHDLTFLRRRVYEEMAVRTDVGASFVDEAFELFDHWRNQVDLFPGAESALAAIAKRVPVVALTNGNASVERIGLGAYFQVSVHAGQAGAAKPDRQIFDLALQHLQMSAEEVLHVGDDPTADVAGAQGAGIRVAWINRQQADWQNVQPRPDFDVRDLGELVAQLQSENYFT